MQRVMRGEILNCSKYCEKEKITIEKIKRVKSLTSDVSEDDFGDRVNVVKGSNVVVGSEVCLDGTFKLFNRSRRSNWIFSVISSVIEDSLEGVDKRISFTQDGFTSSKENGGHPVYSLARM